MISKLALSGLAICLPFIAEAADTEKGKTLFAQRCAMCHGEKGAGDGILAATMPADAKPRNLAEWKLKFATDDAKLKDLLKKGGAGVGLNALMPPQADLTDADLDNLVAFLHTLKVG